MVSIFEFGIYGKISNPWPNGWDLGQEVDIFKCKFTHLDPGSDDDKPNISIKTRLAALDKDNAEKRGLNRCANASNLLAFSTGNSINLNYSFCTLREVRSDETIGQTQVAVSYDMGYRCIGPAIDIKEILRMDVNLSTKNQSELEVLNRSIHWYTLGEMETDNQSDRFIKFWIALEVLLFKDGKEITQCIRDALTDLYQRHYMHPYIIIARDSTGKKDIIKCMRDERKSLFHEGVTTKNLNKMTIELESILKDLLRGKLGLEHKDFARPYLEEKTE